MIHPVDVPVLFAERRRFRDNDNVGLSGSIVRRNAYGQCVTNKITSTVLPQVVLQRGMTLWSNLFKETSRLPVTKEEKKDASVELHDRILFPDPVEPPTIKSPLELRIADLFVEKNAVAHHTADFDVVRREDDKKLVIRRGQPFTLMLLFYRDIDASVDQMKLVFEIGSQPTVSNFTRSILPLPLKEGVMQSNSEGWYAKVQSLSANQLQLELQVSPNCVVGRWNLKVVTSLKTAPRSEYQNSTSLISDIYIFFNPWNKDDTVYMDSEDLDEYVLNDVGKIWRGNAQSPRATYWSFGQFEEGVLEACVKVLNKSALPYPMRSNPAQVVRTLADMVQSPEEYSIIEGLWTPDVFTGTMPTDWTGSSKILQQYIKTGRKISYGHCWVFAGLMTTICRCLGIPTRVVTCYQTAHDSQKFVAVDYRVNRSGEIRDDYPQDNIWTYHVWNECWMKRPDLMSNYDGWQVVDPTPQEKGGGGYTRIGPTPIRAVKEGRVDLMYDAANVICEVNADKFYWVEDDIGEEHLVETVRNEIGLLLSTKRPGRQFCGFSNEDRLDLTDQYKLDPEHRNHVFESILPGYRGEVSAHLSEKISEDVKFELQMNDLFSLGEDVNFKVLMENTSDEPRDVTLSLRFEALHFVTRSNVRVKQEHCRIIVPSRNKVEFSSVLHLNDYLNHPGQCFSFLTILRAVVCQTQQIFLNVKHLGSEAPKIQISVLGPLCVRKATEMELVFLNPLPITLTGCKFIIDGPGILEVAELVCKNVHPRAAAKVRYSLQPFRIRKDAVIIVIFSCDQLKDVSAAISTCVER